jgi:hypothetical protein
MKISLEMELKYEFTFMCLSEMAAESERFLCRKFVTSLRDEIFFQRRNVSEKLERLLNYSWIEKNFR